ncbi:MAG: MBL fold metallo-hydrolase [Lentisphaeria bacterium]|jgi:glyoxylase-like metal-dependent hydrolase (beta-lactamase superfamily II)
MLDSVTNYSVYDVGAVPGGEAFLLVTAEKSALIDSGFSFCAERMLDKIVAVLGERPLDYVLLTHSHYDHASGSAYCKYRWPDLRIVASAHTAKTFAKESARRLMRELNAGAARLNGCTEWVERLDELTVDCCVGEGDAVSLGGMNLRVLAAPGHTRCCIMFYEPASELLISCETLGVLAGAELVMPCCLVDYQLSLAALDRAMAMPIRRLLLPHHGLIEGDACRDFLRASRYWLIETRRRLREAQAAGKSDAELRQLFRDLFYTGMLRRVQPEQAFDINAGYSIPLLLKE